MSLPNTIDPQSASRFRSKRIRSPGFNTKGCTKFWGGVLFQMVSLRWNSLQKFIMSFFCDFGIYVNMKQFFRVLNVPYFLLSEKGFAAPAYVRILNISAIFKFKMEEIFESTIYKIDSFITLTLRLSTIQNYFT